MPPQEMGETVKPHRVKTSIAKYHLRHTSRRRVFNENCSYIFLYGVKHKITLFYPQKDKPAISSAKNALP
jgi:hypothetical protein